MTLESRHVRRKAQSPGVAPASGAPVITVSSTAADTRSVPAPTKPSWKAVGGWGGGGGGKTTGKECSCYRPPFEKVPAAGRTSFKFNRLGNRRLDTRRASLPGVPREDQRACNRPSLHEMKTRALLKQGAAPGLERPSVRPRSQPGAFRACSAPPRPRMPPSPARRSKDNDTHTRRHDYSGSSCSPGCPRPSSSGDDTDRRARPPRGLR